MRLVMTPSFMPPSRAIVRVKALGLDHFGNGPIRPGLWSRNNPDGAVGQYSIHVKENDFDAPRAILGCEVHAPILSIAARHRTKAPCRVPGIPAWEGWKSAIYDRSE